MKDIIYLINGGDDRFKIGITSEKRLQQRIKQLQTGSSCELYLVTTYKSNFATLIEKALHREYWSKHLVGEWFELSSENVVSFKERCSKIEENIKILANQDNYYILKQLKR